MHKSQYVQHEAALKWTPARGNKAPACGNAEPLLTEVMNLHFSTPNRAHAFTAAEQTFSRPTSARRIYAGGRLRKASDVFTLWKTSAVSLS